MRRSKNNDAFFFRTKTQKIIFGGLKTKIKKKQETTT